MADILNKDTWEMYDVSMFSRQGEIYQQLGKIFRDLSIIDDRCYTTPDEDHKGFRQILSDRAFDIYKEH